MIFGIVIALLFVAIVFFHYLQGFFSAALSAIIAVLSAALAFSWHEAIAEKFLQDKYSNVSDAIVLVALFAIIYTVVRVIFDKVIPAGIRLPALIDHIGGALMGAVAAIFALGIFAVAAAELPFGPSLAGYTRYATTDKSAQILSTTPGTRSQQQDATNFDELNSDLAGRFDESDRKNTFPWIICGVDDAVVNTVSHLSQGGSLAGDQPLSQVHPDFLQEMFAQRLGIQAGAQHSTFSIAAKPAVTVAGVFTVPQVRLSDPELIGVRPTPPKVAPPLVKIREIRHVERLPKSEKILKTTKIQIVGPGVDPINHDKQILVVVRLEFGQAAADTEDARIRFSPGAVRLVANQADASGKLHPFDYYPLGTVEGTGDGPVLYVDKLDDFLVIPLHPTREGAPAVDLLYAVDAKGFSAGGKIDPDVFVEFKRMSRVSLSGKEPEPWVKDAPGLAMGVLIKSPAVELNSSDEGYVPPEIAPAAGSGMTPPPPGASQTALPASAAPPATPSVPPAAVAANPLPAIPAGPAVSFPGGPTGPALNVVLIAQTPELPVKISIASADKNKTIISIPRVLEATIKNGQFQELTVNPQATLAELSGKGDLSVEQFFVPAKKVAWQIIGDSPPDPFDWLRRTPNMTLIDSAGAEVKPFGCWAVVNNGPQNYFYARYNPNYPIDADSINPVPTVGKESRVAVIFLLPPGATPAKLKIDLIGIKDITGVRTVTTLK
ncbi:MAG TPA: CvpA family protein [Tepidisphaeraceae bacterium]|jgi:hypothetical protein|nr:CvpA family protein [Tepidisphaeraceae bacterium]